MSTDGCDPVPVADNGMVSVDYDGDGYAETIQGDQNRDGYYETLYIDRNVDGVVDEVQQDTNLDGRVDVQQVDDNFDRTADRTFVDTDGDGTLEQQGVMPTGQPGSIPAAQPADQGYAPGTAPADQGGVPTDFSGQSPEDLAQWLNHPNVQANPELEALIKRMLSFNTNASYDFLNIDSDPQ